MFDHTRRKFRGATTWSVDGIDNQGKRKVTLSSKVEGGYYASEDWDVFIIEGRKEISVMDARVVLQGTIVTIMTRTFFLNFLWGVWSVTHKFSFFWAIIHVQSEHNQPIIVHSLSLGIRPKARRPEQLPYANGKRKSRQEYWRSYGHSGFMTNALQSITGDDDGSFER